MDCVKIDGSYVRGLADNVDNQLFIRTLLGLAEGFGLATVAECVETAADATHLTRRGVRFLQGYLFGRPTVERPWLDRSATPRLALVHGGLAADAAFPDRVAPGLFLRQVVEAALHRGELVAQLSMLDGASGFLPRQPRRRPASHPRHPAH